MPEIYVVTGAAGFVGNNVVRELIARGKTVRGFVRSKQKAQKALQGLDVELFYGDIRSYEDFCKVFEGDYDFVVINAAAIVSIGDKELEKDMFDVNVNGTANVLRVCQDKNVKRLVQVSSVHAIPEKGIKGVLTEVDRFEPKAVVGKYAKTKSQASALVMEAVKNGLDAVLVHPAGIIGPNDFSNTHLTQMIIDYNDGKIPAAVKGGYDFVDVRDVARGAVDAAQKAKRGECYLLTGGYYSVRQMLDEVYKNLPKYEIKKTLPMWVARLGLPFLYLYFKAKKLRPLYTSYSLYTLRSNANFSHDKAARDLGYTVTPFSKTIKDTVDFLKAQGVLKD